MTFKKALVTGASSGIGEALCNLLAEQGIELLISGRDAKKLDSLAKELRSKVAVTVLVVDLAIIEERRKIVGIIHDQMPDLVINNAGFGLYGDALTYTTEEQMKVLGVNGNAVLEITLEAARVWMTHLQAGVILNVSSAAAFHVIPALAVYSSTKTFVNQISKTLDAELKPYNIRVLAACPGMVDTNFSKRAAQSDQLSPASVAMDATEAAQHIWWQIQKRKRVYIFDWKTRWATYLSYFIPARVRLAILRRSITARIPFRPFLPIDRLP